ncbi:hypothetical protein [Brevundimonas sp. SORGH_AS_0993]|nr:hypothetical protein [Brevundimonas sp. SORGH_AS_0993]MDQ1154206.1 hypothetical protein [Brevundimonas sp. SORGH_AS_0993]
MTAPVLQNRQTMRAARRAPIRLFNPVIGYTLAAVVSAAIWGLLLSALF